MQIINDIDIVNKDCMWLFDTLDDNSIDCLITDPPYKIVSGGMTCGNSLTSNKWNKDVDNLRKGKLFNHSEIEFSEWLPEVYRVLKDGTDAYIMVNGRNLNSLITEALNVGFKYHNILVWVKNNATPNRWYMQCTEFIVYLYKPPAKSINHLGTKNVFNIKNVQNKTHPTEKPIRLLEILINNSTKFADTILDPFSGTFSTAIASYNTGRKFIGSEIDKKYFDIGNDKLKKLNRRIEW